MAKPKRSRRTLKPSHVETSADADEKSAEGSEDEKKEAGKETSDTASTEDDVTDNSKPGKIDESDSGEDDTSSKRKSRKVHDKYKDDDDDVDDGSFQSKKKMKKSLASDDGGGDYDDGNEGTRNGKKEKKSGGDDDSDAKKLKKVGSPSGTRKKVKLLIKEADTVDDGDDSQKSSSPTVEVKNGDVGSENGEEKEVTLDEEDKDEKVPEKILDMKVNRNLRCPIRFLVKWANDPVDSWVSEFSLNCNDIIKEFLADPDMQKEYQDVKDENDAMIKERQAMMSRVRRAVSSFSYSERDEDHEVIIARGTKSRKLKVKVQKPVTPVVKSRKKKKPRDEVEKVIAHRKAKGTTEFRVRWKNFRAGEDSWIPLQDLDCPDLLIDYYQRSGIGKEVPPRQGQEEDESDSESDVQWEVEKINGMREKDGVVQYKVRWKGWGSKHDSWVAEEDLSCPSLIKKYKNVLANLEKQDEWKVEKIVDVRDVDGEREFLVHWEGCSSKDDSWEPEDNLVDFKRKITDFFKHQNKAETEDGEKKEIPSESRSKRRSGTSVSFSKFFS